MQNILQSFNTTISEEHAWALFYQCAKCFIRCLQESPDKCRQITEPDHILLQKDGSVHPKTLLCAGDSRRRKPVTTESQLVVNLALVIYQALDHAQTEDEERLISPDLGALIDEMTSIEDQESCGAGPTDTDDEGIERDSGELEPEPPRRSSQPRFTLRDIIERCAWRCGGGAGAGAHYQAVCRALLAEAVELASFLERVRAGGVRDLGAQPDTVRALDTLRFSDWARFWVQVIGELRMGVKLKKVQYSHTPIEYELTPYEILMDDIRSRRYTLRKVDGNIPQRVKKDAHAMILEFIRSRPPLKKASERKLPPPTERQSTPRELLLASIQRGRPLRPTVRARAARASAAAAMPPTGEDICDAPAPRRKERVGGFDTPVARPQRRLIKVDFDNLEDYEDEDEDLAASPEVASTAPRPFPRSFARPMPVINGSLGDQAKPWIRTAYDLATQCPSRRASMRRHTVVACSIPTDGSQSLPQSRPASRQSGGLSAGSSEMDNAALGGDISWSRSSLQDDLIKSVSETPKKQWQDAMMSLSLTLEEIVHIRSVLTKADLEVLPVEGGVKEDVEKRRVCFLCLKTRFGIFGPWRQHCKLCKKTICQNCCSKMRIPTEHFSNVPVVLLSPSLMPSPEEEMHTSFPRSLMARLMSPEHQKVRTDNSVGSAPSSPSMQRNPTMMRSLEGSLGDSNAAMAHSAPGSRGGSALGFVDHSLTLPPSGSIMSRSVDGPQSMPVGNSASKYSLDRRSRYSRGASLGPTRVSDKLRGMQMIVCHDCKTMVLQIIKSSKASRTATRNNAIRNLTLNLSPVYTSNC